MSETISLNVLADMRLVITPTDIAREGEHNSALFKIVSQPVSLDPLACRAEIQTQKGTTYRLVTDGAFSVTNDFTVPGPGRLQLVYSDGTNATRKTTIADFRVTGSLNAVDEGNPDFQDGLAQLQANAFASAIGDNTGITFYNMGGLGVDHVLYPPAQGGGDLTEDRANTLYLRLNGASPMQSSIGISGPNRGITWEAGGEQGALYSTGTQLVLRLPINDPPFVIEPNSGSTAQRSPVITQATGDVRYVTPDLGDIRYVQRSGAQMTGPFISQLGSSNTNLGLSVGENSSGFWKSSLFLICASGGAMVWQASTTEMMLGMRVNMATQGITNLADPVAVADAVNQRSMTAAIAAAVAAVPRPNNRTYLTNTLELLNTTTQILLDQLYPVADNSPRTIVITVFPSFQGGTPSAFYDLIYTCSVAPLIEARSTVYPTAGAYMQSPVRFAATLTPVNNVIQVQIVVRLNATATSALTIVGSGTDRRSYVTIEEQAN